MRIHVSILHDRPAYPPVNTASSACDPVKLCRPCAPLWATYMTKSQLQLQLHRSVWFPHGALPFSYFISLFSSALASDLEAARRGRSQMYQGARRRWWWGFGGRHCVSANGQDLVVKADGNPRRHLCIWKTPIWNGVVYRGKIKHAVTCRQFEPLPPMLACRPFRTNCVGRVWREERSMKGWKGGGMEHAIGRFALSTGGGGGFDSPLGFQNGILDAASVV